MIIIEELFAMSWVVWPKFVKIGKKSQFQILTKMYIVLEIRWWGHN